MTRSISGSCLCGAVRFQIVGKVENFFLCHCRRCRKDTGSAHAANMFSTSATVEWLSGHDLARTFLLPGTRHRKCFCSKCGSALPNVDDDAGLLVVPAGSLDDSVDLRPDAHICGDSRADWDNGLEKVPTIAGLPGS
ncbi:GFA family protein [uncultured Hoeflea sp.]|uniref:GFA family protein n=1 Tax=uncultured Hoeflea sp. TaxID=538666 RepID=UPI0030D7F9D0|tara:strand:+ start:972 stop:1382 length:411 start_codon:yes stop_codon:yes gene_type:complete